MHDFAPGMIVLLYEFNVVSSQQEYRNVVVIPHFTSISLATGYSAKST
jgi:hypothetical protein